MIKIRNQAEFDAVFVTGIANLPQNEIIRIIPIPQGYEVKAPIVITKSNVIIQGYGVVRPKLRYTGTSSTTDTGILYFTGAVDAELENIIVEYLDLDGGDRHKVHVNGIYAEYCGKAQTTGLPNGGYDASTVGKDKINKMGVIVRDCWLQGNQYYGIMLQNSANCRISKNAVKSNTIYGIHVYFSNNNIITGNIARENVHCGIYLNMSSNNIIVENIVTNSNDGIGIVNSLSKNNVITGNIIQDVTNNGISLPAGAYNNTIIGNVVQSCGATGINLEASGNNAVTGNIVQNSKNIGINIKGNGHAGSILVSNTISQETGTHIVSTGTHPNYAVITGNIMTGLAAGITITDAQSKQVDNIKVETAVV